MIIVIKIVFMLSIIRSKSRVAFSSYLSTLIDFLIDHLKLFPFNSIRRVLMMLSRSKVIIVITISY